MPNIFSNLGQLRSDVNAIFASRGANAQDPDFDRENTEKEDKSPFGGNKWLSQDQEFQEWNVTIWLQSWIPMLHMVNVGAPQITSAGAELK